MSFDQLWEERYKLNDVGFATNNLLFYILDVCVPGRQKFVCEFGCGLGWNIDYWLKRSADYRGIDGSRTAIEYVHDVRPYLIERIACADFSRPESFGFGMFGHNTFDVVFDRASVCHNNGIDIRSSVANAFTILKPGGIYIGCDWFSSKHSEFCNGVPVDDAWTRNGYASGQFTKIGKVHFCTEDEIDDIFKDFEKIMLQERLIRPFAGLRDYTTAVWDLAMRKPA